MEWTVEFFDAEGQDEGVVLGVYGSVVAAFRAAYKDFETFKDNWYFDQDGWSTERTDYLCGDKRGGLYITWIV